MAWHDVLTGLPNRRQLFDRLRLAQLNSTRTQQWAALLFIDLDNFKALNDACGHQSGDKLLVQLGQSLRDAVRANDLVARLGGDEFVILLEQLGGDEISAQMNVQKVQDTLRGVLNRTYPLGNTDYRCSGSIGQRLFFGRDDDRDRILGDADRAMYYVKQAKRNNVCLFGTTADPGI